MAVSKEKKTINNTVLLEVKNFSLFFRQYKKGLHETKLQVIRKLNMTINEGEIVAVIGASGAGKSLLANAIVGILPENAEIEGTLNYKGELLTRERQTQLRGKEISLIPQSVNALDPLMKTGKQVQAVIPQGNKKKVQRDIFRKIGLSMEAEKRYPFELSGGMARRTLAAAAMVSNANLIVADEPTPGLDPQVLLETMKHLKQLAAAGKGIMFITHDLDTAIKIADKVVVFHAGETIETANISDFTGKGEKLRHPYTKALWNALPQNDFISLREFQPEAKNIFSSEVSNSESQKLQVTGISYSYHNNKHLFRDLDLSINPGEIVGLFGYSGSGKTTMAQVIAGYIKPQEGTIKVDGKTDFLSGVHPVQLIFQHPEKAMNPKWQMKKVLSESRMMDSELLSTLGIQEEWLTRWPNELSGGELQRISVARALNANTKYIIADEMTTMLDAVTQANIWRVFLKLARNRDIGILAISHDRHLLKRISDRIINFNDIKNV